jgi:hypothetical protein
MTLTVFLLDYQRFSNILERILPALLHEECVSQIIICHGSHDYVSKAAPNFHRLEDNEMYTFEWKGKQILRIQDPLNQDYQCFRRWIWIERMAQQGFLLNQLVLTHDDDFLFHPGEIFKLLEAWNQRKGICICGSGGRDYSLPSKYTFREMNGPCRIAVGQSILLSVGSVIDVSSKVKSWNIPLHILHEDDIVVSLILGKGEPLHYGVQAAKWLLPSPNARWKRRDHIVKRNETADWILIHLATASSMSNCPPHLRSLSTIGDKPLTS